MGRVKLHIPDSFEFSTEIHVRITDLNYGGHLGNDAILSIIHKARVRYLNNFGFTEFDVEGSSIIMTDSIIVYKAESFYGEVLLINVTVTDIEKFGCDFIYLILNKENKIEIARAKTGIVFFDYSNRKINRIPEGFIKKIK